MNELKESNKNIITEKQDETIIQNEKDIIEVHNREKYQNKTKESLKVLKKIYDQTFQTRAFILLIGVILLLKTILLYKVAIFNTKPIKPEYIKMSISFIAIILAVPMLVKGKARFWVILIVDLLISILLFINELYYSFSSNLVSVSQISNLQYGKEISAALPNLMHIRQMLYFIDIIIFLILFLAKKIKLKKEPRKAYIIGIIYLICMIFISNKYVKIWLSAAQEYQYNKIQQIEKSSIYGYHYLDLKNNFNMKKNVK